VDLLRISALAALLLALVACGRGREEGPRTEPPVRESPAAVADAEPGAAGDAAVETPAPREISTDTALASDPGAGSPSRESSQRVVEEGKGYMIAGRTAEAASRFDTASRIDPTNGFAWYWLGRARIAAGDRAGAIGVLEKAESLLGPYPEWRDRAGALLAQLR
jgi:tetratricopeptide (TPR) repeat protein